MVIGEIIKKCRTERKITQEEMAEALHVTPQTVSRWETGISYPDIAMIPQISKFLNVSADRLLGCADTAIKPTNSQQVLNQSQIDSIFDYVPGQKKGAKKILVVDDADFMRMMLRDILSTEGHQIIEAQNGMECLNMLETEQVDICILDINMPVMGGIQTLEILREKYPELKVIILSIECTEETVRKTLSLGADGFVAKPFQASSIVERMV